MIQWSIEIIPQSLLKEKEESPSKPKEVLVEKEVGSLKQALHTDDGEEYNSHDFVQFCENHGIKHQFTKLKQQVGTISNVLNVLELKINLLGVG